MPPASANPSACSTRAGGVRSAARMSWWPRSRAMSPPISRPSSRSSNSSPPSRNATPAASTKSSISPVSSAATPNPQRWQDVENLLGRGIGVITAVNVQHILERQDDVARVTGKRAAYSVPEAFLIEADDIEVVDAPPEALLGRGDQTGLPDARQLAELRELALVLAANVVDRQLQGYLTSHGIAATWGVQERILVCLTPRSNAAPMLI